MKKINLSSFALLFALIASSGHADPAIDQSWHTVLSCDGGNSSNCDPEPFLDDQWISFLVPQATYPAGAVVTSFNTGGIYGSQTQIDYGGTGLNVTVVNESKQTANWYFHSCVRQ
jgi:hypothetical protein